MLQHSIEVVAVFFLLAAGLTQIYVNRLWVAYYRLVVGAHERGMRLHGLLGACIGGLVLRLHPVWHGAGSLLTFLAALLLAEGAMCFFMPRFGLAKLIVLDEATKARAMFFTGVTLVIVAGVLAASLIWPRV